MNIDISKILQEEQEKMEQDGVIEKKLRANIREAVLSSIESVCKSYEFRQKLRAQMEELVSPVAADCGLTAYNQFIAQQIKDITDGMLRDDIRNAVGNTLDQAYFQSYRDMRLSDIFKRYVDFVNNYYYDDEKSEYETFMAEYDCNEDKYFRIYTCSFHHNGTLDERYTEPDYKILFYCHAGKPGKDKDRILRVMMHGQSLDSMAHPGTMNDFEALLFNLYYNRTEIVLDTDDIDISTNYVREGCEG